MNSSQEVGTELMKKSPFATEQEDVVEQKEEQVEQAEAKEPTPIYLGNKKFSNVDELAEYTMKLEQSRQAAPEQQEPEQVQGKKVSELLFEDPEKALEIHEQKILKRIKEEEAARNSEVAFWNKFYSDNKDLSDERDVVDFVLNKNWGDLRTMHPDKAGEKLADYTRKALMRFKKTSSEKQELPSGKAKTGPVNTQSAPKIEQKQDAPIDFVSQLKKIQSKRK